MNLLARSSMGRAAFFLVIAVALASTTRARAEETPPLFWTGADLSTLPLREEQGVRYSDETGEADLLSIAKRSGWNLIRVRLWVDPDDKTGNAVSDLEHVSAFARCIKAAGLGFLLDIHYSDTWADPAQQRKPKAWAELSFPELVQKTRDYSHDVVAHLRECGAMPDMVQIGNETRNGLLFGNEAQPGGGFWEKVPGGRDRAVQLLQAGLDGVRDGAKPAPAPKCIFHIPDGQDGDFCSSFFRDLMKSAKRQNIALDFDVVGLSYYPANPWDKKAGFEKWTLAHLAQSMNALATTYGKPIMVVETEWPYRGEARQMPGTPEFAFTREGQSAYYRALIATVKAVPGGLGIGVLPWDQDSLRWDSMFDDKGRALSAVGVLGQKD